MSIVSRWTMGAMASKKARPSSPVRSRMASARAGGGERTGRDDHIVPLVGRKARDLLAHDGDERMRRRALGDGCPRSRRGRQRARRRPAPDGGRPSRMMSEPARRISSCSRPTALVAASSERKELEQTSSARPSVLCASVPRIGAHLVEDDRHAGLRRLPGRFAAGEAAADDVDGVGAWPRTITIRAN